MASAPVSLPALKGELDIRAGAVRRLLLCGSCGRVQP